MEPVSPFQQKLTCHSPYMSPAEDSTADMQNSPLVLTRGLAKQLVEELKATVEPAYVLERFGLGTGSEAWLHVEQALEPHFDVDPNLLWLWLEITASRADKTEK